MGRARPLLIDAGPAINFLATHNERVLVAAIGGGFHAPESVRDEVMRKASQEERFAPAAVRWERMQTNFITIVAGDRNPLRDSIAKTLTNHPLPKLPSKAKDLGELFVVVHAVEMAYRGEDVHALIDDRGGQQMLAVGQRMVDLQRLKDPSVGALSLMTTESVLESRIATKEIPDKEAMRRIYGQLQSVCDGLPTISGSGLLTHPAWAESLTAVGTPV